MAAEVKRTGRGAQQGEETRLAESRPSGRHEIGFVPARRTFRRGRSQRSQETNGHGPRPAGTKDPIMGEHHAQHRPSSKVKKTDGWRHPPLSQRLRKYPAPVRPQPARHNADAQGEKSDNGSIPTALRKRQRKSEPARTGVAPLRRARVRPPRPAAKPPPRSHCPHQGGAVPTPHDPRRVGRSREKRHRIR